MDSSSNDSEDEYGGLFGLQQPDFDDGSDEDSEDSDADNIHAWSIVRQEPITITFYSNDDRVVASFVTEVKGVLLSRAADELLTSTRQQLTISNMVKFLFCDSGDFMPQFSARLCIGLKRLNPVNWRMVRLFSSFTRWCCCTYKRLYNRLFVCSKSPMLSFTRFKRLINALAASDRRNVDSESSWTESDFLNPQFSEAVGVFRTSLALLE